MCRDDKPSLCYIQHRGYSRILFIVDSAQSRAAGRELGPLPLSRLSTTSKDDTRRSRILGVLRAVSVIASGEAPRVCNNRRSVQALPTQAA